MSVGTNTSNPDDDVRAFLYMAASHLDWGDLDNKVVMDVGCGTGLNSTLALIQLFPKIRKVIAIDHASDLIRLAKLHQLPDQVEFLTADIQDIFTISPWEEQMTTVVSMDCFNWLPNPKKGFIGIYSLLCSRGTAAVVMNINSPYQECLRYLVANSNWKYTDLGTDELFPSCHKKISADEYETMLDDIGFRIIQCREFERIFVFPSTGDFFIKGIDFLTPFLIHIPKTQHGEFKKDFYDAFTLLNGLTPDGNPCIKYTAISLLLQKP